MGTTLTPKSLPSLVWILRSVFFLLCGLASASPSTTLKQLDVRDNEDAVFRNFEFQACSSENKDLIKTAYLNIQNLVCKPNSGRPYEPSKRLISFPVDRPIGLLHRGSALSGRKVD